MRDASGFKYFLSDQLGSISVVLSATGTVLEQQRYLPFGGVRTDIQTPPYRITSTDFTYTGQRNLPDTGLIDYNARFYSPTLGRFIQPDTVIPGAASPQSWNRYSYVTNNPVRFTDPTGHREVQGCGEGEKGACVENDPIKKAKDAQKLASLKHKSDEQRCRNGSYEYCSGYQGFQIQINIATGILPEYHPGEKSARDWKPLLVVGVSLVFDKHGGFQLYGNWRDPEQYGAAEKAYPTKYIGFGGSIAIGAIHGTEFAAKGTEAFAGETVDWTASGGPIAVDHYEMFDESTGKTDGTKFSGDDIGLSVGTPSIGRIAVTAYPLTPRLGLPIRDLYDE